MKRSSLFLFVLLLAAALLVPAGVTTSVAHAAPVTMFFPETGHNLSFGFLNFWTTHGGLANFGFPRTEEFQEVSPTDGQTRTVQYFERARFEFHPEFAGTPNEVELGLLGTSLTQGRSFPGVGAFPNTPQHRFFPQTGHSLNFGFLNFWNTRGGLPVFGLPISEEFQEASPTDGQTRTVQYFERARFEFHPENPPAFQVELGLLGNQYIQAIGLPQSRLAPVPPLSGPGPTGFIYGFNAVLFQQDLNRVLGFVRDAGFGWVRIQVPWSDVEPVKGQINLAEYDRIVDAVNNNGLKILFSVTRSPSWAGINGTNGLPANPNDFGDFMSAVATRYRGRVSAYQLWNEPNTAGETAGNINVGTYVNLLKATFPRIKVADPGAIVVSAGLTPTGVNNPSLAIDDAIYLDQMYAFNNGEVRGFFDVLGAHAGGYNNPPGDSFGHRTFPDREFGNHPSFFFRRVEELRNTMVRRGDGAKQMWLTEFGWSTANQAPGFEYGKDNTEQDQANYLVQAFNQARAGYPWMGAMFVWNLNYATVVPPTDEKAPFGVLNADFTPRPSYDALRNLQKIP